MLSRDLYENYCIFYPQVFNVAFQIFVEEKMGENYNLDSFINLYFMLCWNSYILGEIPAKMGKSKFSRFPTKKVLCTLAVVSKQIVFFATALLCEGIESEAPHSLKTWPMAKLSTARRQHFQTCLGGSDSTSQERLNMN